MISRAIDGTTKGAQSARRNCEGSAIESSTGMWLRVRKFLSEARQLLYIFVHPIKHWQVVQKSPSQSRKYLGNYLNTALKTDARRRSFIASCDAIADKFPPLFKESITGGVTIWERKIAVDQPTLRVILTWTSANAIMEGELQLDCIYRSKLLSMRITLTTGEVFGVGNWLVVYVGGIQGGGDCRVEMREAAKNNAEIWPGALLLLAAQTFSRQLGIDTIVGVTSKIQNSSLYASAENLFDFDKFWIEGGGISKYPYYILPATLLDASTPRTHRSRARQRRKHKLAISNEMELNLAHLLRRTQ